MSVSNLADVVNELSENIERATAAVARYERATTASSGDHAVLSDSTKNSSASRDSEELA